MVAQKELRFVGIAPSPLEAGQELSVQYGVYASPSATLFDFAASVSQISVRSVSPTGEETLRSAPNASPIGFTSFVLTQAGTWTLQVVTGNAGIKNSTEASLVVVASDPVTVEFVAGFDGSLAVVGTDAQFQLRLRDQYGNAAVNNSLSLAVTAQGALGAVTKPAGGSTTVTFTGGVATGVVASELAQLVEVTLGQGQNLGTFDASATANVTLLPGPATQVRLQPVANGTVDDTHTAVVRAYDQFDNFVPTASANITVEFVDAASPTTVLQSAVARVRQGVAQVQLTQTSPLVVQVQMVDTFALGLDVSDVVLFTVIHGVSTRFQIVDPADGVVGRPELPGSADTNITVVLRAVDQYGNLVASENRDVTLVLSGAATFLTGSGLVDVQNGVGSAVILDTRAETVALSLRDSQTTGLNIQSTQTVVVVAGAPTQFAIPAVPDTEVGAFAVVKVQILDQHGNLVTFAHDDVTLRVNGSATGGGLVSVANGQGSLFVTDSVQETVVLSLTDSQGTGLDVSATAALRFVPPVTVLNPTNARLVRLRLTLSELNAVKRLVQLATSRADTFLTFGNDSITDMAGNPLLARAAGQAVQVSGYGPDRSPPALRSFEVAMPTGRPPLVLTLQFSETVNVTSFDPTVVRLHNASSDAMFSVRLTDSTVLDQGYSDKVVIQISAHDLQAIKNQSYIGLPGTTGDGLARRLSNTYLSLPTGAVYDMVAIPNVEVADTDAQQVSVHNADLVPPFVASAALNMLLGTLRLQYSEAVNASAFDITVVSLQSAAAAGGATIRYSLNPATDASVTQASASAVLITLSRADLNWIKAQPGLGTATSNSYVALAYGSVVDLADNLADPVLASGALGVATFVPDTGKPVLQSFDLDLTAGLLTLRFSETVNGSSLDPTEIIIQNARSGATTALKLTGGTVAGGYSDVLVVTLTLADTNTLKAALDLATTATTTFLSLVEHRNPLTGNIVDSEALNDMAGNPVQNIVSSNALAVSNFTADAQPAVLTAFSLNMNTGVLLLTFVEPVNVSSFVATDLSLAYAPNASASAHTLTGGAVAAVASDPRVVSITMTAADLNTLKALPVCNAAEQRESCYVYHTRALGKDNAGVPVQARPPASALKAAAYVADTQPPVLQNFVRLDLLTGRITLSFSETIDISSLDAQRITLQTSDIQGSPDEGLSQLNVTGGTLVSTADGTQLVFDLNVETLNLVKEDPLICSVAINCFLSAQVGMVLDMAGNPIATVYPGRRVQTIGADNRAPALLSFALDLTQDLMTLTFSEPIRVSSLAFAQLTLQPTANASDALGSYRLTGGHTTSPDGIEVVVGLLGVDANAVRARAVASAQADTYLSLTSSFATDMAFRPNAITAIPASQALLAAGYVRDSNRPRLLSYALNLFDNDAFMTLTFSEAVNLTSLDVTGLTFQSAANASVSGTQAYGLTGGTVTTVVTPFVYGAEVVTLALSDPDTIALKSNSRLATEAANTFLSVAAGTIRDMAGNQLVAIAAEAGQQVNSLTSDLSPVSVTDMALDFEANTLTLTFDDVVDPSSMQVFAISLQDAATATAPNRVVTLATSTTNSSAGYFTVIRLTLDDRLRLLRARNTATRLNNTFLIMGANAFNDINGRDVIAVTDGNGVPASAFQADVTAPRVTAFELDMNNGLLSLTFSEAMDTAVFNTSALAIHNNAGALVQLTGARNFNFSADQERVDVLLALEDLYNIQRQPELAVSAGTTFLQVASSLSRDYFANAVVATPALAVSAYEQDTTAPALLAFSVDMTQQELRLTFNEVVNASSAIVSGNVQADNAAPATVSVTLTGGTVTDVTGTVVLLRLATADVDALQLRTTLYVSQSTAFLRFSASFITDMVGNAATAVTTPVRASAFVADTRRPSLVSLQVNMDLGTLLLSFDEPVDVSTLNASDLVVQSTADGSGSQYRLTGGVSGSSDGRLVMLNLTTADLNAIKLDDALLTARASSFVSLGPSLVLDMAGNPVNPISDSSALQAAVYEGDTTEPLVQAFDLDLNSSPARLTLYFPETVNVSSLQFTSLRFQTSLDANLSDTRSHHTLTGGTFISRLNAASFTVHLAADDVDQLKVKQVAVSPATAWLAMEAGAIHDMNNVPSQARVNGQNTLRVSQYTADTTRPRLEAFDVNMNLGQLSFFFSEPVDASTLDVTQILLQNARSP